MKAELIIGAMLLVVWCFTFVFGLYVYIVYTTSTLLSISLILIHMICMCGALFCIYRVFQINLKSKH